MIETKACCKECKYVHSAKGPSDDGSFVDQVFDQAQLHADDKNHEVEFLRHEHRPVLLSPREFPPGPGLRPQVEAINPLNDSYV